MYMDNTLVKVYVNKSGGTGVEPTGSSCGWKLTSAAPWQRISIAYKTLRPDIDPDLQAQAPRSSGSGQCKWTSLHLQMRRFFARGRGTEVVQRCPAPTVARGSALHLLTFQASP